jgi:TolB-like protein/Tfp pilus assembly protein PilF
MSDDSEQEYFSDGLSEELLNLLAQIPELRVTSRTSAFSFKGTNTTVPEVGRALGVQHVLEGSVRRSGDQIRITAQLIDVSTDTHIWSDTWDRNFEDVFVIQDEIAEFVVDALKIELLGELPHVFQTTTEAYELYLQAKFLLEQLSAPNILRAEGINQQLIDMDPEYVPAWNQRALIFQKGPGWNTWPMAESAPRAREAALKSLQLFESNAEAHAILGEIAFDFDYDYELASIEIKTALEMGGENVIVLQVAAELEYRRGNLEKSIEYLEKAHSIDPITGRYRTGALSYTRAGRYAQGIDIWEEVIKRSPDTPYYRKELAIALLETGDIDGAIAALEQEPTEGHRLHGMALIYQTIGDSERSKETLDQLIANSPRWTYEVTEVYAYLGELDKAFEWMDRAIERRDRGIRHVMASPYLDNMKADPRFDDVLVRLGLRPTL